ncbi:hypothetical protein MRB53_037636 [Persea americana]|nr:hypothetical protein MRB53_037636 [Persea americana]
MHRALGCERSRNWLRSLAEAEHDLREKPLLDALTELFLHKIPNSSIADAESLGSRVIESMLSAGALQMDEEWLKFGPGRPSGVLVQMTTRGCYSPWGHEHEDGYACYARSCQRNVRKFLLLDELRTRTGDWANYYGTEEQFMEQLNVLRTVYRDALISAKPPIISPRKLDEFLKDVFGKVEEVQRVNQAYLLPQLKFRQQEQGPWISGISDIFRDWIRKARDAYIDYAGNFPNANYVIRLEDSKNMLFHSFLENARNNKLSNKLGFDTYLKAPITRLQRYTLLLSTVHKSMVQDSEEKTNLQTAIDEVHQATMECDARVEQDGTQV